VAYQQTATYTKYQKNSKHQFSGLNHRCLTTPEYRPHKYNINNLTPGTFGRGNGPRSLIFFPGHVAALERTTGRRARTTTRRGRGAATFDDPAVGLAPGGRTERSADALNSPLSTASATTMSPDSAHQLTDQAHLSTASATTMPPDSPQFPDLSRRTDSLRRPTPARLSHSVGISRRLRRPTKHSFAPSHTKTTPISHGLKLEPLSRFDHKSCRPLLRASRTQSTSHLSLCFAIFSRKLANPRG